jgi:hypothetical protein
MENFDFVYFVFSIAHIIHNPNSWCPLVLIYSIAVIAYSEYLAKPIHCTTIMQPAVRISPCFTQIMSLATFFFLVWKE